MKAKRLDTTVQSDRWSYLWLAIGTLLGFFWRVPLVWWLSPIFLLRFTRTQKVWRGFLLIWLSTFVTASVSMYEIMNALMPSPLPLYLATMAVTALLMGGLPYLVDRLLAPRLPGFAATLVFPMIVTSVDYLSAMANPMGSVGAQAYFQYGNLALMQLLSITGMWGITFLVSWLGPVVNWAWERKFVWPEIRRGVAVYAGVMLLVMLYGGARLAYAPDASSTVRMHGFTAVDMRQNALPTLREAQQQDWQTYRQLSAEIQDLYLEGTVREARAGAQLVHWPEMAVMLAKEDEAGFVARGQQIAREEGIYLAMGLGVEYQDGSPNEIKLIVADPAGEIALEHYKYGGAVLDGIEPGDGVLRTTQTPFGTLSGIICNNTNHEEVVSQAGRNGTDILLSPSLEFREIDPIHAYMAIYRAIENGVTVVRQADNGLSFVVDPYGRTLASVDHWTASERVMVAQVPAQSGVFTIYPYVGDLFAWLAIAGTVAFTIWAVVRGRQARRTSSLQPVGRVVS